MAVDLHNLVGELEALWLACASDVKYTDVAPNILYIYNKAKCTTNKPSQDLSYHLYHCKATLEITWERLNEGHWSEVPAGPRSLYAHASLLHAVLLLKSSLSCEELLATTRSPQDSQEPGTSQDFQESTRESSPEESHRISKDQRVLLAKALAACDLGLLLGSPLPELQKAAHLLNSAYACLELKSPLVVKVKDEPLSPVIALEESSLPPALPVAELFRPSLQTFMSSHFSVHQPVLLKDCMEHWPARSKWNPQYLRKVAGGRTVPVELGVHYADEAWSQRLMTLEQFVDTHLCGLQGSNTPVHQNHSPLTGTQTEDKGKIGYLAQHPLFDQVPELRDDICEPEYCCLRDEDLTKDQSEKEDDPEDLEEGPDVNAWFGPAGTLSPLHFDPKHNLLAQVRGYKRIWLFSPEDSPRLYPHHRDTLLSNTARVDPDLPDLTLYPEYAGATGQRCILGPGQMLYIPPKWWHHVRALTPSMSVSFWWQ